MTEACHWPRCKDVGPKWPEFGNLPFCDKHYDFVAGLRAWLWDFTKKRGGIKNGSPFEKTDLALAQDLAAKIAKGNNDALIPQLQNAIAAAQSDIDGILAALHVTNTKDATTNAKRAGKMSSTSLDRL